MRTKVIALTGFASSNTSIAAAAASVANTAMTLTTSLFVLGGDLNNPGLVTSAGGNGIRLAQKPALEASQFLG